MEPDKKKCTLQKTRFNTQICCCLDRTEAVMTYETLSGCFEITIAVKNCLLISQHLEIF